MVIFELKEVNLRTEDERLEQWETFVTLNKRVFSFKRFLNDALAEHGHK